MLLMKQTAGFISIYAADVSGAASALFELGGMTVIHDASGCNSTYNTHDEPRWYDTDSMVYISALTEMEAIMGDDDKLIHDIEDAAASFSPAFIAIAGTPIPMMMGTDLPAIASVIESDTGIPCFGLPTNSMHSYIKGAGMAFEALARRIVMEPREYTANEKAVSVNILGMTPLDFSVNGTDSSLRTLLNDSGLSAVSTWAMGSTLEELRHASAASVNLVVSACGIPAARELEHRFGTPYVTGIPYGKAAKDAVINDLLLSAADRQNRVSYTHPQEANTPADIIIIGEAVASCSLAYSIEAASGRKAAVICPLEPEASLLRAGDEAVLDESEIITLLHGAGLVIADPLYKPVIPKEAAFAPLAHEAFSGRIYRREIPDLILSADEFIKKLVI